MRAHEQEDHDRDERQCEHGEYPRGPAVGPTHPSPWTAGRLARRPGRYAGCWRKGAGWLCSRARDEHRRARRRRRPVGRRLRVGLDRSSWDVGLKLRFGYVRPDRLRLERWRLDRRGRGLARPRRSLLVGRIGRRRLGIPRPRGGPAGLIWRIGRRRREPRWRRLYRQRLEETLVRCSCGRLGGSVLGSAGGAIRRLGGFLRLTLRAATSSLFARHFAFLVGALRGRSWSIAARQQHRP